MPFLNAVDVIYMAVLSKVNMGLTLGECGQAFELEFKVYRNRQRNWETHVLMTQHVRVSCVSGISPTATGLGVEVKVVSSAS